MATILIGAIITALVSGAGMRIAMWRTKVWLAANKDVIKWELIYFVFGPDPNKPVPPAPPPKPKRYIIRWWLNDDVVTPPTPPPEPPAPPLPPSRAEQIFRFDTLFFLTAILVGIIWWYATQP